MQKTIYIITRHLDVRNGRQDEFVKQWFLLSHKEQVCLSNSERSVVVIHGYRERFSDELDEAALIACYKSVVDSCKSTSGEHGLLCHTFNHNLPFNQTFADFAFACTYSIVDGKAEWKLMRTLIQTLDGDSVARPTAFNAAFDALWGFLNPDITLKQDLEAEHKKLAENVVGIPTVAPLKYSNHTQHFLLIWNTISGDWFAQALAKYLKTLNDNKGLRFELVTSRTAYESVDWSVNWRKVFVLAELYWSDRNWEGIPLVFDLLKKRDGDDQPLEILTCSVFSRNALYESVKDKDHLIVKAFPHLQLKDEPDFSLLSKMYVSQRKWQYKRSELLDNREILSSLLHQIGYIKPERPNFRAAIGRLYNEILNLRSITGKDALLTASQLKDCNNVEEIIENLAELKSDLEVMLKKLEVDERPEPHPGQVMIVEDDDLTRRKIFDLFSRWFQDVITFDNGAAALAELRRNAARYDALVTDLELLDEAGFEDAVQGVDLIDFCEQHARWIVQRVVTGLARSSLPRRLTDFGANQIILKQSPGQESEEIVFVLPHFDEHKFMKELHLEVDNSAFLKQKNMPGPSKGKFAAPDSDRESPDLKSAYYEWKQNHPEDFDKQIQIIFAKARLFTLHPKLHPVSTKTVRLHNTSRASWEPYLWNLLTLRLIAIARQICERRINYIDYGDDSGLYFDLGFKATLERNESKPSAFRQWFNTKLGFSFEPDLEEHEVRIELDISNDELFPHEQDLKKDGQIENFIPIRDLFSIHCCDQVQEVFNKILNIMSEDAHLEDAITRMRAFSSDSWLADFSVILKYLLDYPGKEQRKLVVNLIKIIKEDIDNRDEELNIPYWLEKILYDL